MINPATTNPSGAQRSELAVSATDRIKSVSPTMTEGGGDMAARASRVHDGALPIAAAAQHFDGPAFLKRLANGSLVFLDGRNEHGSHVLASFPTSIPDLDDDLSEQAEQVLCAAEALGFAVGQHVWARFIRINDGGGFFHWEFVEIDAELTRDFFRAWGWDGQDVSAEGDGGDGVPVHSLSAQAEPS